MLRPLGRFTAQPLTPASMCLALWLGLALVGCGTLLGIDERGAQGRGAACTQTSDCASGFCVEGVCCQQACTESCETCALSGSQGLCRPQPQGVDCATGLECDGVGVCREPLAALGQGCGSAPDCASDVCIDSRCCERACNSNETCSMDGLCLAENGESCSEAMQCASNQCENNVCCAQACEANERCTPEGECRLQQGEDCLSDLQCHSSLCIDDVCCDGACNGTCERCDGLRPGVCTAVALDRDPDDECGASCDGAGACREVLSVHAGGKHSCAMLSDGTLKCWGRNTQGELGIGKKSSFEPPTTALIQKPPTQLELGNNHTCATFADGGAACWGRNNFGQLGNGSTADAATPEAVMPLGGALQSVLKVSAGHQHTCAIRLDGAVFCWGANGSGQLGNNSLVSSAVPVPVNGIDGSPNGKAIDISTGGFDAPQSHSCAVLNTGAVVCWGYNLFGQLGDGTSVDKPVPTVITSFDGTAKNAVAVVTGRMHTCALLSNGSVECWGESFFGQIGSPGAGSSKPVSVAGIDGVAASAVSIHAGGNHSCAKLSTGSFRCWGGNSTGQLGDGSNTSTDEPVLVALIADVDPNNFTALSTGDTHTCAAPLSGALRCWGDDSHGQVTGGDITVSP